MTLRAMAEKATREHLSMPDGVAFVGHEIRLVDAIERVAKKFAEMAIREHFQRMREDDWGAGEQYVPFDVEVQAAIERAAEGDGR